MKISNLDPLTSGFTPATDMFPLVHAGKTWRVSGLDFFTSYSGGPYLPLTGGTVGQLAVVGGSLTVSSNSPNQADGPKVFINSGTGVGWPGVEMNSNADATSANPSLRNAAGYIASFRLNKSRWTLEIGGSDQELGANSGTNFAIRPFTDAGGILPFAFFLTRAGTGYWDGTAFSFGQSPRNSLTVAPGAAAANPITLSQSGTGGLILPTLANLLRIGTGTQNALTITPGAAAGNAILFAPSGTGSIQVNATVGSGPLIVSANTLAPVAASVASGMLRLIGATNFNSTILNEAFGSAGANGSGLFMARSANGTPAVPTATALNQRMAGLLGAGYGATAYGSERAAINFHAAQAFTDTAQGAYIAFLTTPIGGLLTQEQMRLTDAGVLQIFTRLDVGVTPNNVVTILPGATAATPATLTSSGTAPLRLTGGIDVPNAFTATGPAIFGQAVLPGGALVTDPLTDRQLDITFFYSLPAGVTFTRAGTGTCFDSGGVMRTAAVDTPRFEYDPITHAPRGLLLEESRTNLFTFSTITAGGGWVVGATTFTVNAAVAPDGTTTMTRVVDVASTAIHSVNHGFVTVTAGQMMTFSVFAKAGENRYLQVVMDDNSATGTHITFDLLTGTISGPPAVQGTAVCAGAWMQPVGNGVYRCSLASTAGTVATSLRIAMVIQILPAPGRFTTYTGVATNGLYLWGAQMEAGSFPTSLIPTTGSTVTRAIDSCSMAAAAVTPWFSALSGSWMAEFVSFNPVSSASPRVIGLPDTASGVSPAFLGPTLQGGQYDGTALATTNVAVAGAITRLCSTWIANQARVCLNGGVVASSMALTTGYTGFTTSGLKFMTVIAAGSTDNMSGYLRRVSHWRRLLLDSEMKAVSLVPSTLTGVALDASPIGEVTPAAGTFTRTKTAVAAITSLATLPGGATITSPTLDATLDLLFLDALPAGLTFTRSSPATYFDANGVMQTAGVNQPRFDYDPITYAPRGLLLEDTRTNLMVPSNFTSAWSQSNVTFTFAAGIAPDGTNTAVKMAQNTNDAFHGTQRTFTLTASQAHTVSVYAKAAEFRYLQIIFDAAPNPPGAWATFDLVSGVVSGAGTGGSGSIAINTFITPVGNGWYRIGFTATMSTWTTGRFSMNLSPVPNYGFYSPTFIGANTTDGVLIWNAQAEMGDYPTSLILTTTATVVRQAHNCNIPPASMGFFTGSPGGSWFAEFDYLDGTPANGIRVISQAGAPTFVTPINVGSSRAVGQYDMTASLLAVTITNANTTIRAVTTWAAGLAKVCVGGGAIITSAAMTTGYAALLTSGIRLLTAGGGNSADGHISRLAYWPRTLADAEMTAMTTIASRMTNVALDSSIIGGSAPAAGTFTRAEVGYFAGQVSMPGGGLFNQVVPDTSLDLNFTLGLPAGVSFTRASANATYFDVNGVMQTAGTNVPRFEYDPVTHVSRGLLFENAATNTMTLSDALGSFADGNATRSFAQGIAPNGTNTAVRITEDTSAADHAVSYLQAVPATNTSYTASAFFKAGTRSYVVIEWRVAGTWLNGIAVVVANLNTGTIFSTTPGVVASSIMAMGNGWYRVSVTATTVAAAPPAPQLWVGLADNSGNATYTGTTGYAFAWGVQVEVGAIPTSYISSVSGATRAFDAASMPTSTAWFNSTAGTLLAEFQTSWTPVGVQGGVVRLDDGTDTNMASLFTSSNTNLTVYGAVGGVTQINTYPMANATNGLIHSAILTYGNTWRATADGEVIASSLNVFPLPANRLMFGCSAAANTSWKLNGYLRRVQYWPRAHTNAELQSASGAGTRLNWVALENSPIGEASPANGTFLRAKIGSITGPTWTTGSAVPSAVEPNGSLYSRVTTWAAGATLYVSKGGGAWTAVASV